MLTRAAAGLCGACKRRKRQRRDDRDDRDDLAGNKLFPALEPSNLLPEMFEYGLVTRNIVPIVPIVPVFAPSAAD
jgi:hypothetical protein